MMHDFACTDPADMKYPVLAERVRYFKEDRKGVVSMCKAMEEMRAEAAHARAIAGARRLLAAGKLSCEEIADAMELPVEEVKALENQKSA